MAEMTLPVQAGPSEAEIERAAAKLSDNMRLMLKTARPGNLGGPRRCYGRSNTKKALRERGILSGDYCYLTPFGEAVRAHLQGEG